MVEPVTLGDEVLDEFVEYSLAPAMQIRWHSSEIALLETPPLAAGASPEIITFTEMPGELTTNAPGDTSARKTSLGKVSTVDIGLADTSTVTSAESNSGDPRVSISFLSILITTVVLLASYLDWETYL